MSGTIQDGFELRKHIDYLHDNGDEEEEVFNAVFLGWGVVRGVWMYFDVKERDIGSSMPPYPIGSIQPVF